MRSESTGRTRRLPLRLLIAAGLALLLAACGSSSTLNPGYPVVSWSATNSGQKFASYTIAIDTITLTEQNGTIISLLPVAQTVDLVKLSDISELVSAYSVPYGTYVSATILFDYSAPYVLVNRGGKAVQAQIVGTGGTSIAQVSVTITFDPAKPLVVNLQQSTPVHMNFDLLSFNVVDDAPTIPLVTVAPYVTMNPANVDATPMRARGGFVVVQSGNFIMNLRPFYSFQAQLGAVVVYPTANAYYNVNGIAYTGAAGLAAMTSLAESTSIVAYGTLTSVTGPDSTTQTNPTFSATEIYAGTSQENGLSYVSGMVSARAGNVLTVLGATLNYYQGSTYFFPESFVTIDSTLPVAQDGANVTGLSSQSISVGQYVYISGNANNSDGSIDTDANGNLVFDATETAGGTARLLHTRLWGIANGVTATSATFDLVSLGIFAPVGYNFAGTGASTPANPAAYVVNTGALEVSSGSFYAIDGVVTPFGSAPPDFAASALTPGVDTEQALVVQWPAGEVAPFTSASAAGYVVNLSKASIAEVSNIFTGPAFMDLSLLPASPLITTTGASQANLQLAVGSYTTLITGISFFTTPAAYYTAVHAALNGTARMTSLLAVGHYNSVSNTFVAERINMALL